MSRHSGPFYLKHCVVNKVIVLQFTFSFNGNTFAEFINTRIRKTFKLDVITLYNKKRIAIIL